MNTLARIGQFATANAGNIQAIAGALVESRAEKRVAQISEEIAAYNAENLEQQAKAAIQKGRFEALKLKRAARKRMAANIAKVGAGGGLLTGSKLLLIADDAAEVEREAQQILLNAQIKEAAFLGKADVTRFRGRQFAAAANIRARQAKFGAIGPLFSTAANLAAGLTKKQLKTQPKQPNPFLRIE